MSTFNITNLSVQKTRLGHLLSLSFFFFLSWALGSILLFILWPINCFGIKDLGFECSGSIRYTTIKTTSVPQDRRLFFFLTVYNKSSQRGSAHFCKAQIHLCPTAGVLQCFWGADLIDCALGCPTLCLYDPCQSLTNGLWALGSFAQ